MWLEILVTMRGGSPIPWRVTLRRLGAQARIGSLSEVFLGNAVYSANEYSRTVIPCSMLREV
jgi:hypothetical protein